MKDNNTSDGYLSIFIIVSIVFIVVALIFPFAVNHYFSSWSKSGTFGDSFGALNALFSGLALSGVIVTILIQRTELKNQKLELSLQRNEMKETRKEFLLNRTTTLVYNQLDRFEKALSELTLTMPNGALVKGNDAILFLDENKKPVYQPLGKSEEEYSAEMKDAIIKLLKIYGPNKSELNKFSHNVSTSVDVLKRLIYKTDLEIEDLNDLKNLFFVNIGFINMGVIERIVEVANNLREFVSGEDCVAYDIDCSSISHADIFLSSIVEFYNLKLTKENFEEHKNKWIDSLGNLEK